MNEWMYGDSFELLKKIPDNRFDCILTDPPYDLLYEQILYLHTQFTRICSGAIIVFCPPENQWVHPANQYLFWIKPMSTKNTKLNYSRFVEMIMVYGRLRWNNQRHWSQYTNVFMDLVDDASIHPYRKPPSLIERLLLNHTDEGDSVLDPFAGSGVIPWMCAKLHRQWLAIEKEQPEGTSWVG